MKNTLLLMLACITLTSALAQKKKPAFDPAIPLTADRLNFQPGKVEFLDYKNQKAIKISTPNDPVTIKDLVFKDGTIEFDVEPLPLGFAKCIYFHRKDQKEQEIVYLRIGAANNKLANEAIQYTPYFDGINMWDMYPQYQGPAPIRMGDWNHLKLVISGKQMKVYMNWQPRPVLEIPKLEGSTSEGNITFEGAMYIANVKVYPNETAGLNPSEGVDLTNHDANYMRKWAMTKPVALPTGSEITNAQLPKPEEFLDSISAEREGMINLTRRFGANENRKVIWLKTKVTAKEPFATELQLGFSDEIWLLLNGQMTYVDKNLFLQNMRKTPGGRMSILNSRVPLKFKQGENEIAIAVANDFYGWGIVARLAATDGLTDVDQISSIIKLATEVSNIDLDPYLGVYASPDLPVKITFTKNGKTLIAQATGQQPISLTASGNHIFRFDQAGIVLEFKPTEKKMILKEGNETRVFTKE